MDSSGKDLKDLQALQAARDEVESFRSIIGGAEYHPTYNYVQELRAYRDALLQIRDNPEHAVLIATLTLEKYKR